MPAKSWRDFTDRLFWSLLLGVCGLGVNFLREMSQSVHTLNERMAVIISRVENHEVAITDYSDRIKALELATQGGDDVRNGRRR